MRPDAKLTESPSNREMGREQRENQKWPEREAEKEMEAEEASSQQPKRSKEHFIHKNQGCSLWSQLRNAKEDRWEGEIMIHPLTLPSPSETFYPAPSLGDAALRPAIRISIQPHCPPAQGPWSPNLRDPGNEF